MTYSNEICVQRYPENSYLFYRQDIMDAQIEQLDRLWTYIDTRTAKRGHIFLSIVHIEENLRINRAKFEKMKSYKPGRLQRDILEVELYGHSRFPVQPEERFLTSMQILADSISKLKTALPPELSLLQEQIPEHTPRDDYQSGQHLEKSPCYYAPLFVVAAIALCAFRIL